VRLLAAASGDASLAFIEIGAVALVLAVLSRVAGRLRITAIPFYLVAGLAVGKGGVAPLDISADFISLAAEIGVLLLLLTLGLEYSADELRQGLRGGARPGVIDAAANFTPGFVLGLVLGWGTTAAVLLGGVCWVSSSGVTAKVLSDLDRLRNRETPAILNLLVIEDLAMAAYLPVVAALVVRRDAAATAGTALIARGEFSIVIASLASTRHAEDLGALAAGYVLITAIVGPLAAKLADRVPAGRN
jgi:CPA2 family monovalent cation:H+ antiporter-2